jgi:exonuclease SbcC
MLDRITDLFRRNKAATGNTAVKPGTPAHAGKPAAASTAAPPDPQAEQARAQRIADATRLLDGQCGSQDALRLLREELPADLRLRALARVDDRAALLDIALNDKVARLRLAAAERITVPEDIETLRRDSSDKSVQRHVREALKATRESDRAAQETRARINHVLNSLAQHAARSFEPLYDAKLETLCTAWQPLSAQASAAEQERFAELVALARDPVQRHAAEIAERERAIAAKQELIAACNELETVVAQLRREDLSTQVSAVTALHVTQETRWQEAASAVAGVDAPLEKRFMAARSTLGNWLAAAAELPRIAQDASALIGAMAANPEPDDELLDDWLHAIDALQARCQWPADLLQPPLLAELAQARQRVRSLEKARQLDRQQQLLQLRKRRHALKRMIDEGQLRNATRTMTWLRKRIAGLPVSDAASETAALEPVAEALQRLHDWYEFASVPKKIEVCEKTEALAAEALGAEDASVISERAAQVRELREQWNLLCAADPDADPELRERFNRAAGTAYAPCAAFYAELHQRQDENLARRAALCEELAAYVTALDDGSADWKAVEKHERETRALWKTIEPVRWPDARETQERFSALIGQLRARLDAVRSGSAARRDELIARAVALQTLEPLDAAITAAKRLQDDWKQAGHSDPREDRRQWQAFRSALDAVFARRDAARNAEREAREAAQAEYARAQEETARQKAEEQERRAARDAQQRDGRRQEIATARALGLLESQWLAGVATDTGTLAATLDALPKSPLQPALRARLERITRDEKPGSDELRRNDEALAQLTLDLEIVFELPSPPALATARMQRKVERLNSALRGGQRDREDPKVALLNAWLALGPASGAVREAMDTRFAAIAARG